MFYVLHLSDFHCIDLKQDKLRERFRGIADWVKEHFDTGRSNKHGKKIAAMILTGDFIDARTSNSNEIVYEDTTPADRFELIRLELCSFCKRIGVKREHVVVVPGNHDVLRAESDAHSRLANFIRFANAFYLDIPVQIASASRIEWPTSLLTFDSLNPDFNTDGFVELRNTPDDDEPFLTVLVLSTVTDYDSTEVIRVAPDVLDRLKAAAPERRTSESIRVAAMHNSPILLPDPGYSGGAPNEPKLMSKPDTLIRILQQAGIAIVLHGDKHEAQHTAAIKNLRLGSGPLYTLGAGSLSKVEEEHEAESHLHCLRFDALRHDKIEDDPNCVELEASSFCLGEITRRDADKHLYRDVGETVLKFDKESSYVIYTPRRHREKQPYASGLGTVHMMELAQGRFYCRNDLAKRLLFHYRARVFEDVYNHTLQLLDDGRRTVARVQPHMMYSFFYESILATLSLAEQGEGSYVFFASHWGDHKLWLENDAMRNLLKKQQEVLDDCERRGVDVAAERFIVLRELQQMRITPEFEPDGKPCFSDDARNACEEFTSFCTRLSKLHENVWIGLQRHMEIKNNWKPADQERRLHIDSDTLDLSAANLALFAKRLSGPGYRIDMENAIAFAYTQSDDPPARGGAETVWVSRHESFLKYVDDRFKFLRASRAELGKSRRGSVLFPIKVFVRKPGTALGLGANELGDLREICANIRTRSRRSV